MTADPRLLALLERSGADGLISADPGVVRLLTGHVAEIETGPSPFALAPVVVAPGDRPPVLVSSADEIDDAAAAVAVRGFTTGPIEREQEMRRGVRRALELTGLRYRALAVDLASVPGALVDLIAEPLPPVDLPGLLAVKRPEEVEGVANVVALADAGHAAARAATTELASELSVWAAARAAMEEAAGGRTAVLADLLSGPRCAEVGAPPTLRRLRREDLVLCDLAPRHGGLWGDSCATWAVAEPTPAGEELHFAALAALAAARDALVSGARAGDVDEAARTVMRDAGFEYPHHTGHGIGFSTHEEPRIVPGSERVLEAGMTVALEPGGYRHGLGVRVEQVFVVTEGPPRLLSGHDLALGNYAAS